MRRLRTLLTAALCLLCLAARAASPEPDSLPSSSASEHHAAPASSPAPVPAPDEAALRLAEANELYSKALNLIALLRTRSISLTPTPSTSLFSAGSYTPFFDLIEATGYGPLASIVKYCRKLPKRLAATQAGGKASRYLTRGQKQALEDGEAAEQSFSILGTLYKLTGAHRLLGDYASGASATDSTQSRTKKILNGLAAGASLSRAEVKEGLREVAAMLNQAGEGGKDAAWNVLGDLQLVCSSFHYALRDLPEQSSPVGSIRRRAKSDGCCSCVQAIVR